ncbi:MAG: cytochrome B [Woeseiaceae bacterium]|nr:cytochrome B [Woeseiaceae bacterium]
MKIKVWDPVVRSFHWATAFIFFANYWLIEDGPVHRWLGYGVAGLIMLRLLWGVVGSPHARFTDFFPTPARVTAYLRAILRHEHPVVIGHNPLGALMIIALLLLLSLLTASGWMMGLDAFWGVDWVEDAHETLATVIHGLVGIHVAAVVLADGLRCEGLLRAMITGYKHFPDAAQVNNNN